MKNLHFGVFLICLLFCSCDIPGFLIIENEQESEVKLTIYYAFPEGTDTLNLAIPAKETKGVVMGFGTKWNEQGMKYFAERANKIVLETLSDTTVIRDQGEILRFVEGGRTNLSRRKLFIEVH